LFPAACFSLSLAGHILLIALLVAWASGQAPMSAFEPAPGSPFLEATLIETALLGGGQADHPEADEDGPEPDESPLPPPSAPEAPDWPQAFDLKAPEPETAPEPRPKPPPKPQTAAKRPKTAAQASPSSKKAGHSGPGHPLGSPQGNSAAGGGGAGGLGQSGAVGWQAVRVPQPLYPPLSQQNGEQGRVVAAVVVSPSGRVSSASIVRSSGYARLDQAALSAARHISFRAKSGGAPRSAVTVEVPYRFKIRY
jgi:TonB family protein